MKFYTVGIRVWLFDQASKQALQIARSFGLADIAAKNLEERLKRWSRGLFVGSMALFGGIAGERAIFRSLGASKEYLHILQQAQALGLSHKQVMEGVAEAWQVSGKNLSISTNEALKSLLDLRTVLGSYTGAKAILPIVAQLKPIMTLAMESGGKGISPEETNQAMYSAVKTLEMLGKARNPAEFKKDIGMMANAIIATRGRVTPQMYMGTARYMRTGGYNLSDRFLFQEMPFLMQEFNLSGGGRGTGMGGVRGGIGTMIADLNRMIAQGIINKKSIQELQQIGLVTSPAYTLTPAQLKELSYQYSYQLMHGGALPAGALPQSAVISASAIRGADLLLRDPVAWVGKVWQPFAKEKKWNLPEQINELNKIFRGHALGGQLITNIVMRYPQLAANIQNLEKMPSWQQQLVIARKDPMIAGQMVGAQWENVKTSMGLNFMIMAVPVMGKFAKGLNDIANVFVKHPDVPKTIYTFGVTLMGVVTAFGAVVLLMNPVVLAIVGIAATITALIYASHRKGKKVSDILRSTSANTNESYLKSLGFPNAQKDKSLLASTIEKGLTKIKQNVTVVLDKQKVGEILTNHISKNMSKYNIMNDGLNVFNTKLTTPSTSYRY